MIIMSQDSGNTTDSEDGGGLDFSELPDQLLEQILSSLTLKEAVRTSILSKRWRRINICSLLSNLDFSNWFFDYPITKENSNIRKKNKRLMNAMDKNILERSHSLGVEKLFLEFPHHQTCTGLERSSLELKVDRWMKCVAKPGLTELSLNMFFFDEEYHYDLPLLSFAAIQSLQKLTLKGCRVPSLSYGDIVPFSSLRSLCLLWDVSLDDGVLQRLLNDIPLLENLEVHIIRGPKVLEVRQQQLKRDVVRINKGLTKVVINAPKLEILKLTRPKEAILLETCLPCLRKFKFEQSCTFQLNTLVEFGGLELPLNAWFSEFLPLWPLLEHLSIDSCPMHNINVSTPLQALKTLRLRKLEYLVNIALIAPNLETMYVAVDRLGTNFPVVELHSSNRLEVEIEFDHCSFFNDLCHDRLAKFLGYFNHSRAVKLSFLGCLVPKKSKDFPFPLYGTKYLEFTIASERRLLWEYVDCMLWLSPQATHLAIREDPYDENYLETVLELVYEKNETSGKSSSCACCAVLATTCWRHCLKEVKIQEFVGDEAEKAKLKSWLWEEVENLSITEASFNPDSIYGGKYTLYDQLSGTDPEKIIDGGTIITSILQIFERGHNPH